MLVPNKVSCHRDLITVLGESGINVIYKDKMKKRILWAFKGNV